MCLPTVHGVDETELLLRELQLRMTRAVEDSPHLAEVATRPSALYEILADYFSAQCEQARRSADMHLDVNTVRRVWVFCLMEWVGASAELAEPASSPPSISEAEEQLHRLVQSAPALPLEALQRPAPVVRVVEAEGASPSPGPPVPSSSSSVFSLVRASFSSVMDLAYVADQRLQRSSSPGTITIVSLAALSATLVSTLDRVQAVRLTAQLADDLLASHLETAEGQALPACPAAWVARLLAGVWYVWGVLDDTRTTPLHTLGARLLRDAVELPGGAQGLGGCFAAWTQNALQEQRGALHQSLYAGSAEPPLSVRVNKAELSSAPNARAGGAVGVEEMATAGSLDVAEQPADMDRDFWAQLAS